MQVNHKIKAMGVDIKYLGVPNVCFSLTGADDEREINGSFSKQRIERGFDDSETWSLTDTIAKFSLPRLKRYKEIITGLSDSVSEHVKDVDVVIRAMELIVRDSGVRIFTKEESSEVNAGIERFSKVFMHLWW